MVVTNLAIRVHDVLPELQLCARRAGLAPRLLLGLDHLEQLIDLHHPVVFVLQTKEVRTCAFSLLQTEQSQTPIRRG